MGHHLFRKRIRPGVQQRLLLFDAGDVCVDGDPTPLRQRRAFDADSAPVGAGAFHVVRLKSAGDFDTFSDKGRDVVDGAVFAALCQMLDGVFECGSRCDQRVRQVKHLLKGCIADGQPQIIVINREGLRDQVQPRRCQFPDLFVVVLHLAPPIEESASILPPRRKGAFASCAVTRYIGGMKRLALIAMLAPAPAFPHPHIFVDVGLEVFLSAEGQLEAVKVTWAYDAFYSLLITEDYGLDTDGDAVLTPEEETQLAGFDMRWVEGFNGDLLAQLGAEELVLSGPTAATAAMQEGRIVTTHLRHVEGAPLIEGQALVFQPYDPTFYTAYDVRLAVKVSGMDGCMIGKTEPNLDEEMQNLQAALAQLGRDQDAVEMGFPEVGAAFATRIEVTCADS